MSCLIIMNKIENSTIKKEVKKNYVGSSVIGW